MRNSLMVGYLQSWSPEITFTQAAEKGYTAIVMAFGTIERTNVSIFNGVFAASPTTEALKNDIKNAKSKGAKQILFSVGGANNTYNPNAAPVKDLAKAIVKFLKEFGFTGIDFDLEIDTDGDYLDQLCAEIKALDSTLLITAAPQINQADHGSDLFLVSTGNSQIYNKAIKNKRFDYLFIQAYNNQWPKVNGFTELDVAFISAAFNNLLKSIPIGILIAIGEPANINAAGEISVFHGLDAGKDIYKKMAAEYKLIHNDEQFGGAMTWSINQDAETGYLFVDTMKNVIKQEISIEN